jgi:hypothetical protein
MVPNFDGFNFVKSYECFTIMDVPIIPFIHPEIAIDIEYSPEKLKAYHICLIDTTYDTFITYGLKKDCLDR